MTSQSTKIGLTILGTGLGLGLAGDALLRELPPGLNVWLMLLALAGTGLLLAIKGPVQLAGGGRWLVAPVLCFAAAVAWRDSPTLTLVNVLALLSLLAVVVVRGRSGRILNGGSVDFVLDALLASMIIMIGPLLLVGRIQWNSLPRDGWSNRLIATGRGMAVAIPLILIFGGLFVAADAAFQDLVSRIFRWNAADVFGHLFWTGFWTWITAGLLYQLFLGQEPISFTERPAPGIHLGPVELAIILGSLNALFLAFVVVQFRYFFGGDQAVQASETLTYSEYARRGFFELVTVAGLVLPLLLLIDWLRNRETQLADRLFKILAGTLVLLLFIVMYSAIDRMRLYQGAYGLTELRLYPTAFMFWLALSAYTS